MQNLDGEIQALLTRATPCNDNQPLPAAPSKALESASVSGINVVGSHNIVVATHMFSLPFLLTLAYILFSVGNH